MDFLIEERQDATTIAALFVEIFSHSHWSDFLSTGLDFSRTISVSVEQILTELSSREKLQADFFEVCSSTRESRIDDWSSSSMRIIFRKVLGIKFCDQISVIKPSISLFSFPINHNYQQLKTSLTG